jgi:hypothetical protein
LALVVAGLLVAADLVARAVAEEELAERVAKEVPEASSTSARIHSFPFLVRLLASGRVSHVDVTARKVDVRGLEFESISAGLRGVDLDRAELLRHGKVVVERIRQGTVRAVVTEEALSELFNVPVELTEGRVSLTVLGQQIGADLAVRDGRLVIGGSGFALPAFDLVAPLLPCLPDGEIRAGRLVLSCEVTDVPTELLMR